MLLCDRSKVAVHFMGLLNVFERALARINLKHALIYKA